jgi:hypothetical protein
MARPASAPRSRKREPPRPARRERQLNRRPKPANIAAFRDERGRLDLPLEGFRWLLGCFSSSLSSPRSQRSGSSSLCSNDQKQFQERAQEDAIVVPGTGDIAEPPRVPRPRRRTHDTPSRQRGHAAPEGLLHQPLRAWQPRSAPAGFRPLLERISNGSVRHSPRNAGGFHHRARASRLLSSPRAWAGNDGSRLQRPRSRAAARSRFHRRLAVLQLPEAGNVALFGEHAVRRGATTRKSPARGAIRHV